jgi:hypothetical protein
MCEFPNPRPMGQQSIHLIWPGPENDLPRSRDPVSRCSGGRRSFRWFWSPTTPPTTAPDTPPMIAPSPALPLSEPMARPPSAPTAAPLKAPSPALLQPDSRVASTTPEAVARITRPGFFRPSARIADSFRRVSARHLTLNNAPTLTKSPNDSDRMQEFAHFPPDPFRTRTDRPPRPAAACGPWVCGCRSPPGTPAPTPAGTSRGPGRPPAGRG